MVTEGQGAMALTILGRRSYDPTSREFYTYESFYPLLPETWLNKYALPVQNTSTYILSFYFWQGLVFLRRSEDDIVRRVLVTDNRLSDTIYLTHCSRVSYLYFKGPDRSISIIFRLQNTELSFSLDWFNTITYLLIFENISLVQLNSWISTPAQHIEIFVNFVAKKN